MNINTASQDINETQLPYRFMPGAEISQQKLNVSEGGLNETLNVNHLDIPPDDNSIYARITRLIAKLVGKTFSPHQILVILRVLKALTFCFLVLTLVADAMYIFFVEVMARGRINGQSMGYRGYRDAVLRVYGLVLTFMGVMLELDVTAIVKQVPGLKGFIPRGFFLFFISTLTSTNPLVIIIGSNNDSNYQNDDVYDDDEYVDESGVVRYEVPVSAIVFQSVTSWTLALCAIIYIFLGLMCCDRFTSKAFLSETDPLVSTAIPSTLSPSRLSETASMGTHQSPTTVPA